MIRINGVVFETEVLKIEHLGETRKEFIMSRDALLQCIRNFTVGSNTDDNKRIKTEVRRISFHRFWDMYGRKENKEKAWKGWLKLKDEEIKKIFETLPFFIKKHKDLQFRPMPITYINQKRWEDEIIKVPEQVATPNWVKPNDWNVAA